MNTNPVVQDAPATPPESPSADSPLRILLVDRDPHVRHSCLTALTRGNYHVAVCEDGEAAWRILLKQNFDLLVASEDLPRLSGLALVRQLRLAEINLPIILVAQHEITERVSHDPWHKIAAVLHQPFTPEELLDLTNRVLSLESHRVSNPAVESK